MTQPSPTAPPGLPFGLRWGIKSSFVEYIRRMPDGQGRLGDGAVPVGLVEILYPPERGELHTMDDGSIERSWIFRGQVRFSGHFGMLVVRVAAPALTVRDGRAELTVADPSATETGARLALVTLRLDPRPAPDGIELWQGTDVRLTAAGTGLFNDVYPEGEPFEPLTVLLPVLPPSGSARPPAAT
jgi:hypothetical protein